MKHDSELIRYLHSVYELEKQCKVLDELIIGEKTRKWEVLNQPKEPYLQPEAAPAPNAKETYDGIFSKSLMTFVGAFIPLVIISIIFLGAQLNKTGMEFGTNIKTCVIAAVVVSAVIACIAGANRSREVTNTNKNIDAHFELKNMEIKERNQKLMDDYYRSVARWYDKVQIQEAQKKLSAITLAEYQQKYRETKALLDKLYALDILYYKYRGIERVSKYIEYLESGVCSQLEGPDGAYRLCEQMVLEDIKIANQEKTIALLGQINFSCQMLGQAMREIGAQVSSIQLGFQHQCNTLNNMNLSLNQIGENAAATRYYAQQTKVNTDIMRNFAAYQHLATRQERLRNGYGY